MKTIQVLIAAALVFGLMSSQAMADWEVTPASWDYGDVEVGTSESMWFTITNLSDVFDLSITSISIVGTDTSDFSQSGGPAVPFIVPAGEDRSVEITYSPPDEGYSTAYLRIEANDPLPLIYILLNGNGVPYDPTPSPTVEDILDFFDASVANGSLEGDGPGNSANGRLKALRNMIKASGDLIDDGYIEQACCQLMDAYLRVDDLSPPPDFAQGPAEAELAQMILDLIADLCI